MEYYSFIKTLSLLLLFSQFVVGRWSIDKYSFVGSFHQLWCPLDADMHCKDRVVRDYNMKVEMVVADWKHGPIANLNKILDVFHGHQCHITLTSFRDTKFIPSYPMVLRQIRLAWYWTYRTNEYWTDAASVFLQEEFLTRKQNFTDQFPNHDILNSPYLTKSDVTEKRFHLTLNISRYLIQTKPWNCQVSVALFPYVQLHNFFAGYPSTWLDSRSLHAHYNIFPSALPPITIFIVHPEEKSDRLQMKKLLKLAILNDGKYHSGLSFLSHEIFFHASTLYQTVVDHIWETQQFIDNIGIIQICDGLSDDIPTTVFRDDLWHKLHSLRNWKLMTSIYCDMLPNQNHLVWTFYSSGVRPTKLVSSMMSSLKTCGHSGSSSSIENDYAQTWLSIASNFSYVHYGTYYNVLTCEKDGKLVETNIPVVAEGVQLQLQETFHSSHRNFFPVVLKTLFNDLRFVSCGKRGCEKLPFSELLSVYDRYVWVLIFFCMFVLAAAFQIITSHSSRLKAEFLLSSAKVLLEQGDPFPEKLLQSGGCRCVAGTFFLMAVVLSNAYKNTNVYNMVSHKKIIPYRYLRELIQDNFSIYTRSVKVNELVNIPLLKRWAWHNHSLVKYDPPHVTPHEIVHTFQYPDYDYAKVVIKQISEVRSYQDKFKQGPDSPGIKNVDMYQLFNVTKLIHKAASILLYVVNLALSHNQEITKMSNYEPEELLNIFYEMELNEIMSVMSQCHQVAAVLPSNVCKNVGKDLQEKGHSYVFHGLETFYDTNVAFLIKGLMPSNLVRRIKNAETSGLWERSWNIFKNDFSAGRKQSFEPPQRPSMSGNIVIIFALLLSGLTVAVICFITEAVIYPSAVYFTLNIYTYNTFL